MHSGAPETNETAKFVIASLRSELEKERISHARTHEQAEREIRTLRAQLTRREAELEACATHQDHSALLAAAVHGQRTPPEDANTSARDRHTAALPTLTPEEAVEILGLSVARNKDLELEVKQLSAKVHYHVCRPCTRSLT